MRFFVRLLKNVTFKHEPRVPKIGFLDRAFGKYLFVTNVVSSGGLMAVGDFVQQHIENYQRGPNKKLPYDTDRTVNMSVVATGHGVFHHYFYAWMDRIWPGATVRTVCTKVLLDQIIAGPICLWMFFIGMAMIERRGYNAGWIEMKEKFVFCYLIDWVVWPPNQFINFYYVPSQYRVVYINFLTMLYDVFLSYAKFYDQEIRSADKKRAV